MGRSRGRVSYSFRLTRLKKNSTIGTSLGMIDMNTAEDAEGARGSGYPSDPRTQAYLKDNLDPVFGYKGIVRFSWATVKVLLEKQAVECRW